MTEHESQIDEAMGHEPAGFDTRSVSIAGAGLIGVMFAALLIIGLLVWMFTRIQGGPAIVGVPAGGPPLDDQRGDLRRLRERENKILAEYEWVDAEAGVARIPISRAMEILTERAPQQSGTNTETNNESRVENP
jgi:hypothetical protein